MTRAADSVMAAARSPTDQRRITSVAADASAWPASIGSMNGLMAYLHTDVGSGWPQSIRPPICLVWTKQTNRLYLRQMSSRSKSRLLSSKSSDAVVTEFVEQLGLIVEADGLPRIAGKIFGLLTIYGGPLSFAELSERLAISRGSVSTNTRLLEGLGIIVRVTRPGERQDFFKLAPDPFRRLLSRLAERTRRAQSVVDDARAALLPEWTDARRRLRALSAFYQAMGELSVTLAGKLNDEP
ncbi:MAG: hypothetical protein Q8L22_06255 [Reyranella sp.]|nr:hypothetical protein [Reyranella sp.]